MLDNIKSPSIKLKEYAVPLEGRSSEQISQKDMIGIIPYIQLRSITIEASQIRYFKLESTGIIPTLDLAFADFTMLFKAEHFALDNEIISVYINSRIGSLRDIKMDFKITHYDYDRAEDLIYLKGIPNIDRLYLEIQQAYRDTTSYEVFNSISTELELGLVSNVSSTSDAMNWINPGKTVKEFIEFLTKHTYKDENSFFWSFVDFYYNINLIDVQSEMNSDIVDNVGVIDTGDPSVKGKDAPVAPIILTYGNEVNKNSNVLFSDYEVFNQSMTKSLETGYLKHIYFYNKVGNWEKRAGSWLRFDIDTIQSPGAAQQNIVLKSQPSDTTDFYANNIKYHYTGKLDISNVHSNFRVANVQNSFNIDELQKIYIIITLPNPNFNLARFMKIRLDLLDISTPDALEYRNKRLSGAWIITGIIFELTSDGFVQKLVLCKRELTSENLNL